MNEELKQRLIAKIKSGARWNIRECSICEYPLSFYASNGALYFDPGCECTRGFGPEIREWSSLDFYLDPAHGWTTKIEEFCKEAL